MEIIIVGGGETIHFLAKSFMSKGYSVTIINGDEEYSKSLARTLKVKVVLGDGTKPYILEDAGAARADMVIALTPKDPDNLVICQLASKTFRVERTFALVNDPMNVEIFKKLGVGTAISTADIISSLIEQRVAVEDITSLIPLEEGKVSIMEIEINGGYPVVGKSLSEIAVPKDAVIGCVIRDRMAVIPRGNTRILKDDKLVVILLPSVQSEVLKILRGRID